MEKSAGKKGDMNRWVRKVKEAQDQIKTLVGQGNWMDEARKYADRQSKEVKKLLHGDLEKVRTFVVRERRELEKLQKQIPSELARWKKYLDSQRKELEKVLVTMTGAKKKSRSKGSARSAGKAKTGAKVAKAKVDGSGSKTTAKRSKKTAASEAKAE